MKRISLVLLFLILAMGISVHIPVLKNTPLGIVHTAEAAYTNTWYVATTGSNSGAGTIGDPWETIEYAAQTATANSIVYVRAGTYTITSEIQPNSGSSGNPIVFQNYNSEVVTIDGSGLAIGVNQGLWDLDADDYITIDGFIMHSSDAHGVFIKNTDNTTVQNCVIYECDYSGIYAWGNPAWSCTDVTLTGNEIYDCEEDASAEFISFRYVDGFTVSYNTVYDPDGPVPGDSTIGIDPLGSKNGNIHHNEVYDVDFGIYYDAWASTHDAYIDIYNNITHDSQIGIAVNAESGGEVNEVDIYNNLLYDHSSYGFKIGPESSGVSNLTFVNNTMANNQYGIRIQEDGAVITGLTVFNNIVEAISTNAGYICSFPTNYNSSDHKFAYNHWETVPSQITPSNYTSGNPNFDPSSTYELLISSACIDSGASSYNSINAPSTDYLNVARPQNSIYDKGAYEYYIGSGDQAAALADTSDSTYVKHPGGSTLEHTGKYQIDTSSFGSGVVGTVTYYYRGSVGSPVGTAILTPTCYLSGNSTVGTARTLTTTPTTYSDTIAYPSGGTWTVSALTAAEWWITLTHNVTSWSTGGRCQQAYIEVSFTASSGSQSQVTRTVVAGIEIPVVCSYDGANMTINTGGTSSASGPAAIYTNNNPVHIAEFDGLINDTVIKSNGTEVLNLQYEPEDCTDTVISDHSASGNDATYVLASNPACIDVTYSSIDFTGETLSLSPSSYPQGASGVVGPLGPLPPEVPEENPDNILYVLSEAVSDVTAATDEENRIPITTIATIIYLACLVFVWIKLGKYVQNRAILGFFTLIVTSAFVAIGQGLIHWGLITLNMIIFIWMLVSQRNRTV